MTELLLTGTHSINAYKQVNLKLNISQCARMFEISFVVYKKLVDDLHVNTENHGRTITSLTDPIC